VWNGGLGIYGGVIGGFIGLLVFARVRNISPLAFADAVAPGLVLAQAIGRWGNYFNQELFGRPSQLPWAIRISPENRPEGLRRRGDLPPDVPLREHLERARLPRAALGRPPVRGWLKDGDLFLLYVSLYSTGRFFMELLRIDPAFLIGGTIRGNLLVATVLALGFAMVLLLRHSAPSANARVGSG
jgi:prolipoprotein diacylglyceryltransferase